MIRLTISDHSRPTTHLYHKTTILIGSDPEVADLVLPEENIKPVHVKIVTQDGFQILINDSNDPFVAVNGHPFGKKLLSNGDIITIHQTTILFEDLAKSPHPSDEEDEFNTTPAFSFTLPFEDEVEAFQDGELQQEVVDSYVEDLQFNFPPNEDPPPLEKKEKKPKKKKFFSSLKDDYLKDMEDDSPHRASLFQFFPKEPLSLLRNGKWMIFFLLSVLLITAIIGTVIYQSVSYKTDAQEIKVSQGLADLSMALSYAKLTQTTPHTRNWSDSDFLKSHLNTILPNVPSFASQIDSHGEFNCCPYSFRIYTSTDLQRFLLIAQPAPSLMHWILPKSIIVIDSETMELRRLKDVRSLNRLLANHDPLEGTNSKEISALVKQGELIRLSILAHESGLSDFAPPKNLGWIYAGAENYIYNAPRYYRLSQGLIQNALALSSAKSSSYDVNMFRQEVSHFTTLNHLILYSTQGVQGSLELKQILKMFAPSDNFLFGYLVFNNQGSIYQAHVINEDTNLNKPEQIAMAESSEVQKNEDQLDINHPIYIQLHSLASARTSEIKPIVDQLTALIKQELQSPTSSFQTEFEMLSHQFVALNTKYNVLIKETIEALYIQHEEIPINEFMSIAKELHIDQVMQQENSPLALGDEKDIEDIEVTFTMIQQAKSLNELDNLVGIASTRLNFSHIKDKDDLKTLQNWLRNIVLHQIETFLLSPSKDHLVNKGDRDHLTHLLSHERLIHPEEKSFFMSEYEQIH